MLLSASGHSLWIVLGSCSTLFLMSWIFPLHRPRWQRLSYIVLGTTTVLDAGFFGVNLGLFLQVYAAKSYFLLGRRTAISLTVLTAIPWTLNEYARESRQLKLMQPDPLGLNSIDPIRFAIFTLAIYAAASFFTLMLSHMIVMQQKGNVLRISVKRSAGCANLALISIKR